MTAKENDPMYFDITTLDSGLRIAYKHMPGNRFDAGIMFRVGHMDDPVGKEGLSHLLEHHVFTDIPDIPSKSTAIFKEWLRANRLNRPAATTSVNATFYRSYALNEDAEKLMRVLLNMTLRATCSGNLEHDREIVRKEGSYRKKTERDEKIWKEIAAALLGKDHRYITQTGCSTDDILNAISADDVKKHHQQFYFPGNACIAMIGDIDFARMIQFIQASTADIAPPPVLPKKRSIAVPKRPDPNMHVYKEDGPRSTTIEMSKLLPVTSEYHAYQIATVCAEEILNEHLREKHKLVYSAEVSRENNTEWCALEFRTKTAPDVASRIPEEIWNAFKDKNKIRAIIQDQQKIFPIKIALAETLQSAKLANAIKELQRNQRIETLHERTEKYTSLTQSEIDRVLDEMLDPQFFHTAIIDNRS